MGWLTASRVLRPVRAITATARRLSVDSLDQRIGMRGARDELTELADTFDQMLDRLASSFESQSRFVANASHELRTPIAAQRTLIEVAMADPLKDPAIQQLGRSLLPMNHRIEAVIEGLLTLARSDRGLSDKEELRLDHLAAAVLDNHQEAAAQAGVHLHADLSPATVRCDRVLMERLIGNLVDNAIKHNHRGGAVWLEVDRRHSLRVANTGPVVPAESVPELFTPFRQLRTTPTGAGRGVGLGLSIVASIARAHGGLIALSPREGGGLEAVMTLP
jgi:signal transduction histidine kinase